MPVTYQAIATTTVGSGGAVSIVFSSIPQTYTDLVIKLSARSSVANWYTNVVTTVNDQTSARWISVYGYNGATYSDNNTTVYSPSIPASTSTASTFGNAEMYFPNYTSTNVKTVSVDTPTENNSSTLYITAMDTIRFTNGAAINTITLTCDFVQYSTATLYGIKKD